MVPADDSDHAPGYRPLPGVPDEMADAAGRIRPLWHRLAAHLATTPPDEMARFQARADQYLRDGGVFYRQYGAGQSVERPWPLSHVPVLIAEAEWQGIASALVQRAELLEAVMADLYGPNRLVAEGRLPPALVAQNPEWLRPLVGVAPRSGHFLHFVAFELGRGPDGQWWVLADRTQAPSGAGYALENRLATTRAFPALYAAETVHRLAGFFRDFSNALLALRQDRDARVAVLSPGPLNETYFEHAWIARYLGFTLVQGEDLSVQGGRLMVRTVSGLRPVQVLWRRMDAPWADPLELDPTSRIGTPGLVSALRAGEVAMVNALGSGVLESRAFMAFLPQLAEALLDAPLAMPNIATWWCGDATARAEVLADPARMILSAATGSGMPFDPRIGQVCAADLAPDALATRLATEGHGLIAQEAVTLGTTPVLIDGRLEPRPMTLRVFLARGADGWMVMPGAFARIGATADPAAVAMQHGGSAADVWVVSPGPVAPVSMLASPGAPVRRTTPGALPSRTADNLFWLGRYVERSEGLVRLLRAWHIRLAENGPAAQPLLDGANPLFEAHGIDPAAGIPPGLLDVLGAAVGSAGRVRDRLSPDAWSALADLDKTARRMATRVTPGDDAARALSALLRKLAGFSGLVHENMYRFMGWRFLSVGRWHERAMGLAELLAVLSDPAAPEGSLDLAIEVGDSVLTHRRRFAVAATRETVIDLLALDPHNPRSLRHQIDALQDQIAALPMAAEDGRLSPLAAAALQVQTDLAVTDAETLTPEALRALRGRIGALSDLLTTAYLT